MWLLVVDAVKPQGRCPWTTLLRRALSPAGGWSRIPPLEGVAQASTVGRRCAPLSSTPRNTTVWGLALPRGFLAPSPPLSTPLFASALVLQA